MASFKHLRSSGQYGDDMSTWTARSSKKVFGRDLVNSTKSSGKKRLPGGWYDMLPTVLMEITLVAPAFLAAEMMAR
jgi:hypothetical protein